MCVVISVTFVNHLILRSFTLNAFLSVLFASCVFFVPSLGRHRNVKYVFACAIFFRFCFVCSFDDQGCWKLCVHRCASNMLNGNNNNKRSKSISNVLVNEILRLFAGCVQWTAQILFLLYHIDIFYIDRGYLNWENATCTMHLHQILALSVASNDLLLCSCERVVLICHVQRNSQFNQTKRFTKCNIIEFSTGRIHWNHFNHFVFSQMHALIEFPGLDQ